MMFSFVPFLFFGLLFLLCCRIERRSLACGILFVAAWFTLLVALVYCYRQMGSDFYNAAPVRAFRSVLPLCISVLSLLPTAMVLATLAAGVLNLIQDGLHLRNTFAVFFSFAAIGYSVFWPMLGRFKMGTLPTMIYLYVTAILAYSILLKSVLTVTSQVNLHPINMNQRLDYVVVLGRPLKNERVIGMVRDRVDLGIKVYRKNPGSKLILSGGWRRNREDPESAAMADYAIRQGVPPEDILREEAGDSTEAMVKNSYALMCADYTPKKPGAKPRFAVASNAYHVLRALFAARKNHIRCTGFGARTKLHISMNEFVREYIQYLKLTRRAHLILLALFTVVYWGGLAVLMYKGVLTPQDLRH